jgi:hypothetical protein
MTIDLDKLKAAALAATPGPWNAGTHAMVLAGDEVRIDCDAQVDADFIAAANPAAVLELIAEVERLSAIVEKHIDPKQVMMTGLNVHNGSFSMGLEGGPVRIFAAAFADYFKESPASNYIEMHLASTDPEIGELICTLQRKQGKTPHALRREAEEALRAQAGAVRFAGHVLKAHRNDGYPGDVDGGYLQRRAVECGLVEEHTVSGPCGENCSCAEVLGDDEWPSQCFFNTEAGKAAMRAAEEGSNG